MSRIRSSLAAALLALAPCVAFAQTPDIVSSEISVARDVAELRLEVSGGRIVDAMIRDGRVYVDGRAVGEAPRGGELDREWRDLLDRAMETPTNELAALFRGWKPPAGTSGPQLQSALQEAIAHGTGAPSSALAGVDPGSAVDATNDSLSKLNDRIAELEEQLEAKAAAAADRNDGPAFLQPFRYIWRGVSDLLSLLVIYAVLFGLGFAVIFFGGRKNLEVVADTARKSTLRAGMVGLAASFLVLPVFVLGIIVLLISIVGIPALLAWIPLFPVAVVTAIVLGYVGVAHAAGELFAERRFSGADWFARGNSYYFLLTGLGLLLALFIAENIVEMAGPWFGFIRGLLMFLGIVLTWAAATVGFGAVLLTRGGTRTGAAPFAPDTTGDLFAEQAHV